MLSRWLPSNGRNPVTALGEMTVLPRGGGQPPHELTAELIGFDHRVDDVLGGEMDDVDVLLILGAAFGDETFAFGRVFDRFDLVEVDRVDRGLRAHNRDASGGKSDGRV